MVFKEGDLAKRIAGKSKHSPYGKVVEVTSYRSGFMVQVLCSDGVERPFVTTNYTLVCRAENVKTEGWVNQGSFYVKKPEVKQKFKAGDVVTCVKVSQSKQLKQGVDYIVRAVVGPKMILVEGCQGPYNTDRFKLKEERKEEAKGGSAVERKAEKKVKAPKKSYQFKVASGKAADLVQVYEEAVSRDNPVALITTDAAPHLRTVLVHNSVINKAYYMKGGGAAFLNAMRSAGANDLKSLQNGVITSINQEDLEPLMKLLRQVRDAAWANGKKQTVTVETISWK